MFDCWWTRFGYNEFLCWLKWRLTLSTSCVFFSSGSSIGAVEFCMPTRFLREAAMKFLHRFGFVCFKRNRCSTKQDMLLALGSKRPTFCIPAIPTVFDTHKFMQPCSQLFRSLHPGNASQLRLVWRCHLLNHGFSQFFRFVKQRNGRGKIHGKSNKKSVHVITDGSIWGWLL